MRLPAVPDLNIDVKKDYMHILTTSRLANSVTLNEFEVDPSLYLVITFGLILVLMIFLMVIIHFTMCQVKQNGRQAPLRRWKLCHWAVENSYPRSSAFQQDGESHS